MAGDGGQSGKVRECWVFTLDWLFPIRPSDQLPMPASSPDSDVSDKPEGASLEHDGQESATVNPLDGPVASSSNAEPTKANQQETSEGAETSENVANDATSSTEPLADVTAQNEWQAVWSAPHNAYYFFNSRTQVTTWVNPLQPSPPSASAEPAQASSSTTSAAKTGEPSTSQAGSQATGTDAATLNGIDPELAFLDPSLYVPAGPAPPNTYTAKFNARTGRFTADSRDPSYMSEYERAKRMSSVFFDVDQWEKDVAKRKADEEAEGAAKRKKPTKKDLVSVERRLTLLHLICFSGTLERSQKAEESSQKRVAA